MEYIFLQHYWWLIISLLAGILVFLLFVQGGQGMLFQIGKTSENRHLLIATLGFKWSLTFTTLVTFGGAFFAAFPLFYSTSFGGAFYVWMMILFLFVIQAVAYEFYGKPRNLLGDHTYQWFLLLNGVLGPLLLGVAVATLFTGANFTVNKIAIGSYGSNMAISEWTTPWKGLEAVTDIRNLLLGFTLVFLSRTLASQYFLNAIDHKEIVKESRKQLIWNFVPFLIVFVAFVIMLLTSSGYAVHPQSGVISEESFKYLHNLKAYPFVSILFLAGVLLVLLGVWNDISNTKCKGIWFSGIGTILVVTTLLLFAGWNNTAYYPSLSDMQSSLTIYNSSSSEITLMAMAYVSLMIPFVIAYIYYAWRQMNKQKLGLKDLKDLH